MQKNKPGWENLISGQIETTPAPPVTASSDYVLYTVKQGDTIWDIVKKYPGVTQSEIMRLNNMSDASKLKAGQQIKIKPKS